MTSRALVALSCYCVVPRPRGSGRRRTRPPASRRHSRRRGVPAHLAVVDGAVTLEREGQAQPADVNVALLAGDRLRTERGRAEILFGDGSALDLDKDTSVDLLSDSLIRLRTGRAAPVHHARQQRGRISRRRRGLLGPDSQRGRFQRLYVRSAPDPARSRSRRASAARPSSRTPTAARSCAPASMPGRASTPSPRARPRSIRRAADDFDHWVEDQRDARTSTTSSQYLPSEMRTYGGAFDAYGTWGNEPSYGTVWYPQVSTGWQPYSDGYWSAYGSYGWFWVGPTVWSWPTHHYGRWGVSSGRWFWVPGRQWAPAWVSWATSPGYVGWCPLGVDGRPVGWFNANVPDGRRGWTMATANQFSAANGPGTAVRPQRTAMLPDRTLTERTTAPVVPSARPGASVPLHSPTTTRVAGVPRLDVGQPSGQARPGARRQSAAAYRRRARCARRTHRRRRCRDPRTDRTPSWQARPGEPRPAPTVARPGVWSDPHLRIRALSLGHRTAPRSRVPIRARCRGAGGSAGGSQRRARIASARTPQALPDRGPVGPPDPALVVSQCPGHGGPAIRPAALGATAVGQRFATDLRRRRRPEAASHRRRPPREPGEAAAL